VLAQLLEIFQWKDAQEVKAANAPNSVGVGTLLKY
jgi:hypothetical protein